MKKYEILQLWVPPETRHEGVMLFSTKRGMEDFFLPEIKKATTVFNNSPAKFSPTPNSIPNVTTGKFELLSNKDTSVGWLMIKMLCDAGWELFSTCIDGGYTSHCFRYEKESA